MNKKYILITTSVILGVIILGWAFYKSVQAQPGQDYLWDSRIHLPEGTQIDYKSNIHPNLPDNEPPTSGDHYPSWITKGFYTEPRADGNLVHSQEHGYIIIWYNCEKPVNSSNQGLSSKDEQYSVIRQLIPNVYAQNNSNGSITMTAGSEGSPSATLAQLPKAFSDGSCDPLENQLKDIYSKLGQHKMIIVPRMGMDSPIILTAWGKLEKLSSVNFDAIKSFTDAYRDNGPEGTVEP